MRTPGSTNLVGANYFFQQFSGGSFGGDVGSGLASGAGTTTPGTFRFRRLATGTTNQFISGIALGGSMVVYTDTGNGQFISGHPTNGATTNVGPPVLSDSAVGSFNYNFTPPAAWNGKAWEVRGNVRSSSGNGQLTNQVIASGVIGQGGINVVSGTGIGNGLEFSVDGYKLADLPESYFKGTSVEFTPTILDLDEWRTASNTNGMEWEARTAAEPYTDSNNNGQWDAGEPFVDLNGDGIANEENVVGSAQISPGNTNSVVYLGSTNGVANIYFTGPTTYNSTAGGWQAPVPFEPYVDGNSNGRWDGGESFTDLNGNGAWDAGSPAYVGSVGYGQTGFTGGATFQFVVANGGTSGYGEKMNWRIVGDGGRVVMQGNGGPGTTTITGFAPLRPGEVGTIEVAQPSVDLETGQVTPGNNYQSTGNTIIGGSYVSNGGNTYITYVNNTYNEVGEPVVEIPDPEVPVTSSNVVNVTNSGNYTIGSPGSGGFTSGGGSGGGYTATPTAPTNSNTNDPYSDVTIADGDFELEELAEEEIVASAGSLLALVSQGIEDFQQGMENVVGAINAFANIGPQGVGGGCSLAIGPYNITLDGGLWSGVREGARYLVFLIACFAILKQIGRIFE